jgi:hypothetical protein
MFEDTGSTRFAWYLLEEKNRVISKLLIKSHRSNLKVASVIDSVTDKRPDGVRPDGVIHVESNDQFINVVGYCEAKAEKSNGF